MISETVQSFEENGYVYLPDFLDKENCEQLTVELHRLVSDGMTRKDEQCPLSDAVHGASTFDSLLEQLTPYFEEASGKTLYPTYAYARIYRPGDELKVHTDRPACEISVTLTLGFDGTIWPIYMADESADSSGLEVIGENDVTFNLTNIAEISMNVGDAVLYRGQVKRHWRNKFQGKWQAQVFLHYVDANGPHADQRYDGRETLSHHTPEKNPDFLYWYFLDSLPKEACKKLIDGYDQLKDEEASVGVGNQGTIDKEIRDVNRVSLDTHRGIGATLAGIGLHANAQFWKFDIDKANQVDYLKYDKNGHYLPHVDTFMVAGLGETRKLTVLAFLNDDFEGGKLFLQNGHERVYPPQTAGTVIVFPSFVLHGVEPVTSGIRRSIVTWLVGPWFK
jgi:predicted 2-oxoglutarate/Fe(II)-dependent dioxygenase YbiX